MSTIVEPVTPAAPVTPAEPVVTPTPEPTSILTPAEPKPTTWRDTLPDDLKAEKSLDAFRDVNSLAKAFVETKKMVGQRTIKPLDASSSPEEVSAYRKAHNIPDDPAGYFTVGVSRPEIAAGAEWNETIESEFLKTMHATHATPATVQAAMNYYAGLEGARIKEAVRETQAAAQELRREWGPTFDANLGRANRAIQEFGGDALVEKFAATGMGRDPLVVKAFARIGNALVETGAMQPEGLALNLTPDDARKQIADKREEIKKLPEGHPRVSEIIDQILALTKVIHR